MEGAPEAIHVRVELPEEADDLLARARVVLESLGEELDARPELDGVPRHEHLLLGEDSLRPWESEVGTAWLLLLAPVAGQSGVLGFAGTAQANGASLAVLRERVEPLSDDDVGALLGAFTRAAGPSPEEAAHERERLVALYSEREERLSGALPEWSASHWRVPVRQRAPDGWDVFGASVIGTRHLERGLVCDDACGWAALSDGLALAVADGAGFAERADEGARLAILGALESLEGAEDPGADWEGALTDAARAARARIEAEDDEPAVFSTTLLVAVWTTEVLAVLQIGDGVVVTRDTGGAVRAVTRPDHGEHYNETVFVTSAEAEERMQIHVVPAGDVADLALLSDGLQGLALELAAYRPVPGFFAPFFKMARGAGHAESERLARFLGSARVCARTDDDKTLVVATRAGL